MTLNSDANFDGVLAGAAGGLAAGQISVDVDSDDYEPLLDSAVAIATGVDALVGVTTAPPPLVAQTNILDELTFALFSGRNPTSGSSGKSTAAIEAATANVLESIRLAFVSALSYLGAGAGGSTPIYLNAAFAGAMGGFLAGSQTNLSTTSNSDAYDYISAEAFALATAVDAAIGVIGSPTVPDANLLCELVYAWTEGRNPNAISNQDAGDSSQYTLLAESIAAAWVVGTTVMNAPNPSPSSSACFTAAFAGGWGGMAAGLTTTDTTGFANINSCVTAFAYAVDAAIAASAGAEFAAGAQADLMRQICHAWMKNHPGPNNSTSHRSGSYQQIAAGITAYYLEVYTSLV